MQSVSKSSVGEWCVRIRDALRRFEWRQTKPRNIAIDETCLKLNGERYWVYAAIDAETGQIIDIAAFPGRDTLNTLLFVKRVLRHCKARPRWLRDKAPWLREALELLKLEQSHVTYGLRNRIERLFGYLKHRTAVHWHNINVNLRNPLKMLDAGLAQRRALSLLNSFLQGFRWWYEWMRC
jgi:transposase-like protein